MDRKIEKKGSITMEFFRCQCHKLGITLSENQISKFENYYKFMIEYNRTTNLTSITGKKEVYVKHFLDSLTLIKSKNMRGRIIDVGSGAGFPGVPLKIYNPAFDVTLLDSSKKRTDFLNKLSNLLDIKLTIVNSRAEILSKDLKFREKFDFCVSRAVANLRLLSELCIPFVKLGGYLVSMKGPSVEKEIVEATQIISILGGKLCKTDKFDLPENFGSRYIILIKKVKTTNNKYPRNYSQIIQK